MSCVRVCGVCVGCGVCSVCSVCSACACVCVCGMCVWSLWCVVCGVFGVCEWRVLPCTAVYFFFSFVLKHENRLRDQPNHKDFYESLFIPHTFETGIFET